MNALGSFRSIVTARRISKCESPLYRTSTAIAAPSTRCSPIYREVAPDLIVHGGDLSSGGAHPAEIIDQIQSLGWPGVCGNTDEMLYAPRSPHRIRRHINRNSPPFFSARQSFDSMPTVNKLRRHRSALARKTSHRDTCAKT